MEERDRRLNEKLAAMNEARGDAKVEAMAAVINELVSQRKEMRAGMKGMRCGMCRMKNKMKPSGVEGRASRMERGALRHGMQVQRAQGEGTIAARGQGRPSKTTIVIIQE